MTAARYRKRPLIIDAVQWSGANIAEVVRFSEHNFSVETNGVYSAQVYDRLHHTWVSLRDGDWVIKGIDGEFYPCEQAVFNRTYELVPA